MTTIDDLKARLLEMLIERYAGMDDFIDVPFWRKLYAETFCKEDSDFRNRQLEFFKQQVKDYESIVRAHRRQCWKYIVGLRNNLLSPEVVMHVILNSDEKRRESVSKMQTELREQAETSLAEKRKLFRIVKPD
jgi:hypothetical protein